MSIKQIAHQAHAARHFLTYNILTCTDPVLEYTLIIVLDVPICDPDKRGATTNPLEIPQTVIRVSTNRIHAHIMFCTFPYFHHFILPPPPRSPELRSVNTVLTALHHQLGMCLHFPITLHQYIHLQGDHFLEKQGKQGKHREIK